MANTAILRSKVEPAIRARLSEEFGQPFSSQVLPLPGGARREFDAVSRDGTVVVSIKTSSGHLRRQPGRREDQQLHR